MLRAPSGHRRCLQPRSLARTSVLVIRQEAPAALGAPTGALGWRLARPREAMVASLLLLLPPLLASQIFVARLGALMTGATRLMTSPSMSWPAPSEEGSLSIPSSSRVHLTMITCSRSLEMFLCPTGGPAFQPSKRRRTGLPPRNPRPALVDTTCASAGHAAVGDHSSRRRPRPQVLGGLGPSSAVHQMWVLFHWPCGPPASRLSARRIQ